MLRVMNREKVHFDAPSPIERLFSQMFGALVGLGLGFSHNYQLEVRGRRSGRLYSTPVDVLVHRGRRFLVAGRGETQWVRNARASGQITLRKGRRREELRVRIVPDVEKPDVLKAYLDRFKLTVQRYFPVPAGTPAVELAPFAPRYPVFELVPLAEMGAAPRPLPTMDSPFHVFFMIDMRRAAAF
jgi:deazaflavin-dependent oxidoreductase (nitroreductase family)